MDHPKIKGKLDIVLYTFHPKDPSQGLRLQNIERWTSRPWSTLMSTLSECFCISLTYCLAASHKTFVRESGTYLIAAANLPPSLHHHQSLYPLFTQEPSSGLSVCVLGNSRLFKLKVKNTLWTACQCWWACLSSSIDSLLSVSLGEASRAPP